MRRLFQPIAIWKLAIATLLSFFIFAYLLFAYPPLNSIEISAQGAKLVKIFFTENLYLGHRQSLVIPVSSSGKFEAQISKFGTSRFQIEILDPINFSKPDEIKVTTPIEHANFKVRSIDHQNFESLSDLSVFDIPFVLWVLKLIFASAVVTYALLFSLKFILIFALKVKFKISEISLLVNRLLIRIPQNALLKIEFKMMCVLLLYGFIYIFASAAHLHGSSVGILGERFGNSESSNGLIFGEFRNIRYDEWTVYTPWLFAQEAATPNFKIENSNVGGLKSTILTNLPNRHFSSFFRPQFLSYLFSSGASAFCFYWNYKIMALLLGSFLLFLILSNNSFWIAWPLSIAFSYSSFIVWWFSSSVAMPEMISAWCFLLITFLFFIFSQKKTAIIISALAAVYFFWSFILIFYPPFQIPLIYVGLATLLGFYLDEKSRFIENKRALRLKVFGCSAALMFLILGLFLSSAGPSIQAVMNLDYPGRRISTGGHHNFLALFFEFFAPVFSEHNIPKVFGNICEASFFLTFFPIVLVILLFDRFSGKRISWMQFFQIGICLFLSYWILWGLPPFLAKITLLDRAPALRSGVGIGAASFISLLNFLAHSKDKAKFNLKAILVLFLSIVGIAFLTQQLMDVAKDQVPWISLCFWLLFLFVLIILLVQKRGILFSILLGVSTFCLNFSVNPVVRGIPFLTKSEILKWAAEKKDKTWLVFASSSMPAQFLKISGAHVLGGVNYLPNENEVRAIDPSGKFKTEMNRYAHIIFHQALPGESLSIKNDQADRYIVNLPFSHEMAKRLNVSYVAFYREEPARMVEAGFHLWHEQGELSIYEIDHEPSEK
jgi:hypothetical protein